MAAVETEMIRLLVVLFALIASPIDDGETLRVDQVSADGVISTVEAEREGSQYNMFTVEGDKRSDAGTVRQKGNRFDAIDDGESMKIVDFDGAIASDVLSKIPKMDDGKIDANEKHFVRLQRSGGLLYLTTDDHVYVAYKYAED